MEAESQRKYIVEWETDYIVGEGYWVLLDKLLGVSMDAIAIFIFVGENLQIIV